jgi:hypothetical protein
LRYSTSALDYQAVSPEFGTREDVGALASELLDVIELASG